MLVPLRIVPNPKLWAKPPHVLMTADSVGGVWTYALDLARELAGQGTRVTLAVLGPSPHPDQVAAADAVDGLELIDTGLALDWTAADAATVRRTAEALGDLAGQLGPDVVHLNSPALAADAGFEMPVVGVCHSCMASWWSAVRGGAMPEDFRWRTELLRRGYQSCDLLVAPSAAFADATAALYGVERPVVVRNGRCARKATPRRAGGGRERFVFTAGRLWDCGKNVALLDAAARRLDAPVFAAGPLESPTGHRVALDNAKALGRLDGASVAGWMARAPVFASLPLYEPFGLTVLEAAQAGCALVLSDIASFRELWDGAAIFADPTDADALAATLRRLLDDPAEAKRRGGAARRRAARYGMDRLTTGMLNVYRSVMIGRPAYPVRSEVIA
ncbi:glycosyltransferase family 4 protein [Azospirillum sp. TSO35-2]|uniref:glycosyltransferase family 4 protein n=1 Tax=Azospirillum sp. TSO35-2 TaxID=716796 RepID=UPI000D618E87|nr:glycosyltransferase family 4 protein [Azospirillum sp. TSO35-2]PWC36106.1 glycosyl transferase family 1 [Azospirillum sp. TSO35-2]